MILRAARWLGESLGACWQLVRLGWVTGFRQDTPYWRWRMDTAFGRGLPASKREYRRGVWHYARWVHRLRREHGA